MKKIIYDISRCDFCGTCVAVCPHDAIILAETTLEIITEKCTNCQKCVTICPVNALQIGNLTSKSMVDEHEKSL